MSQRLVQQVAEKAIALVHSCRVLSLSRSGFYAAKARPARNGRQSCHICVRRSKHPDKPMAVADR